MPIARPRTLDETFDALEEMPDAHLLALPGDVRRGVGFAAVVAAIRAATGLDLTRIPVRPDDVALARTKPQG